MLLILWYMYLLEGVPWYHFFDVAPIQGLHFWEGLYGNYGNNLSKKKSHSLQVR